MSYLGRSAKLSLKAQEKVSFLATAGQTVKTGLSYTPSFVEVYVNGVLLTDTTDFTATNGNSITFTVALLLNDEVTVISLKTFTVADHYTKSDADTLLAAKLAKSGDTMTGALVINSPNEATGGRALQLRQGDATSFGIDMGVSQATGHLNISRVNNGTQAHMMTLARDTGNVGIGSSSPSSKLTSESAASTNIVAKSTNGNGGYYNYQGLASDGTQTFGVNHNGTIFTTSGLAVGGTGAANTLDDYEEGTWTPNFAATGGGSLTTTSNSAYYTKVGNLVTAWFDQIAWSSHNLTGTYLNITGLPFPLADSRSVASPGVSSSNSFSSIDRLMVQGDSGSSTLWMISMGATNNNYAHMTAANVNTGSWYGMTITYRTA